MKKQNEIKFYEIQLVWLDDMETDDNYIVTTGSWNGDDCKADDRIFEYEITEERLTHDVEKYRQKDYTSEFDWMCTWFCEISQENTLDLLSAVE